MSDHSDRCLTKNRNYCGERLLGTCSFLHLSTSNIIVDNVLQQNSRWAAGLDERRSLILVDDLRLVRGAAEPSSTSSGSLCTVDLETLLGTPVISEFTGIIKSWPPLSTSSLPCWSSGCGIVSCNRCPLVTAESAK